MCVTCPAGRIGDVDSSNQATPCKWKSKSSRPVYLSSLDLHPKRYFQKIRGSCVATSWSIFPPWLTRSRRVDICIRFVKKRRSVEKKERRGVSHAPGNPVPWPTAENGWKPSLSLSLPPCLELIRPTTPRFFIPRSLGCGVSKGECKLSGILLRRERRARRSRQSFPSPPRFPPRGEEYNSFR